MRLMLANSMHAPLKSHALQWMQKAFPLMPFAISQR